METKKKKRSGVFIGAYVPAAMKAELKRMAASQHTTLSKLVTKILDDHIKDKTK